MIKKTIEFLRNFFKATMVQCKNKGENTFARNLTKATVRLSGAGIRGTGFLFDFGMDGYPPVIITCAHAIKEKICGLNIHIKDQTFRIRDIQNHWIVHPTEDIGIIVLDDYIARIRSMITNVGCFQECNIPNKQNKSNLDFVENILVCGYPEGLYDLANHLPIARKGITATDPNINYGNTKSFLVDVIIIGGMSGSPVITTNNHIIKGGKNIPSLLGVVCSKFEKKGETTGLGRVVKSECILEMKSFVEKKRVK